LQVKEKDDKREVRTLETSRLAKCTTLNKLKLESSNYQRQH